MREKPIYLTLEGRDGLTEELNHLRDVRRPEVAENIRIAKEYTDSLDNAEFDQAKNEQAFVEGRILTLENLLSHAVMIDPEHVRHDVVSLGVKVEAVDEEGQRSIYAIVGSAEANPVQGKISNESPLRPGAARQASRRCRRVYRSGRRIPLHDREHRVAPHS